MRAFTRHIPSRDQAAQEKKKNIPNNPIIRGFSVIFFSIKSIFEKEK
jgi:hypothetical protein